MELHLCPISRCSQSHFRVRVIARCASEDGLWQGSESLVAFKYDFAD